MLSKTILSIQEGWRWQLLSMVAGALLPLSFAPANLWPVAIVSLSVLALSLRDQDFVHVTLCGFLFALGMFTTGVHWLFVPIYQFSNTPAIPAALLVFLFTLAVAVVYFAPLFYLMGRWCRPKPLGLLLGFPAIWVISEWLRTWLFTGFPWLLLGYSHIDTWLSGWAPIIGVSGISFIVALTASSIVCCWEYRKNRLYLLGVISTCILLWLVGGMLGSIQWTKPVGQAVNVGLAQGNIPQEKKWDEDFIKPTLDRYTTLSNQLWHNDWIVWPEAAIPMVANSFRDHQRLQPLLSDLRQQAVSNNAALITGILHQSPQNGKIYNSIIATGLGAGIYFKQRLVPFGEYAPLEEWLGGLFDFFTIPRSMIAIGPPNQRGLQIGEAMLAPSICYEIVYPDLVASGASHANVLITISNDAWFGNSIGPLQHMQMAQMRALETQRYLIRGTNNGVSAVVNPKGQILVRSRRFEIDSIEAKIELREGLTPFMRWRSEPIVFLSLSILACFAFLTRFHRNKRKSYEGKNEP